MNKEAEKYSWGKKLYFIHSTESSLGDSWRWTLLSFVIASIPVPFVFFATEIPLTSCEQGKQYGDLN